MYKYRQPSRQFNDFLTSSNNPKTDGIFRFYLISVFPYNSLQSPFLELFSIPSCVVRIAQFIGQRDHVSCLQEAENLVLKMTFSVYETQKNIRMINKETFKWTEMGRWLRLLRPASLTSSELQVRAEPEVTCLLYCLNCCSPSSTASCREIPCGLKQPSLCSVRISEMQVCSLAKFPFTCCREK